MTETHRGLVSRTRSTVQSPRSRSVQARRGRLGAVLLRLEGAPGAGKTAFTMQLVLDALRLNPELRALVCNVEVSPTVLLDRQLARLAGLQYSRVWLREFDAVNRERAGVALDELERIADRLAFVRNTFIDFTLAELGRHEITVWLVLYRDSRDGIAQTSQSDIARRSGVSDRTVRRALTRLESLGLLIAVHRGGLNRGCSSYRVSPLVNNSTADRTVSGSTGQNGAITADRAVSDIP